MHGTTVGRKLYQGGMTKKSFSRCIIFLGYKSNFQKSGGHMPPGSYGTDGIQVLLKTDFAK